MPGFTVSVAEVDCREHITLVLLVCFRAQLEGLAIVPLRH